MRRIIKNLHPLKAALSPAVVLPVPAAVSPLNMRRFFLVTLPLLAYLAFIYFLSSLEVRSTGIPVRNIDKVIHYFLYLPMVILFARHFRGSSIEFIRNRFLLSAVVISLIFAITDEWHQYYVLTRNSDVFDWVADAAGILTGALIYWFFLRMRGKHVSA